MSKINSDFNEFKKLTDYNVIKNIVQSKLPYHDKVKELESYATPDAFKRIMKHFKRIYADI